MNTLVFLKKLRELGIELHKPDRVVYKYVPLDTAKLILESGNLMFSAPINFNDPFDMYMGLFDFNLPFGEIRAKKYAHLSRHSNLTLPEIFAEVNKLTDNEMYFQARRIYEQMRYEVAVSCFSKKYDDTLMWSHYGDRHKGVCIGFELPPIYPVNDYIVCDVSYVGEVRPLQLYDVSMKERELAMMNWIFTKSSVWHYEEEVRAVIDNRMGQFQFDKNHQYLFPMGQNIIKEIYFGANTTAEEAIEVRTLVAKHNIKLTRMGTMIVNTDTFRLLLVEENI